MPDSPWVFISYSHADSDLAVAIYQGLTASNFRVWLDRNELRVGDSLLDRISHVIEEVDYFITLVSPSATQSKWCQKELALAATGALNRHGQRVLPLRVDGAEMPAALADQLYLDVSTANPAAAVERLAHDIWSYELDRGSSQERSEDEEAFDAERRAHERALSAATDDPELAMRAAQLGIHLMDDDPEAALAAFQRGAKAGNTLPALWSNFGIGVILGRRGLASDAKAHFQLAMKTDSPELITAAASELGDLLIKEGDLEEAISCFEQAFSNGNPKQRASAASKLGTSFKKLHRDAHAEEWYRRAVELDVDDESPRALWLMAGMHLEQSRLELALEEYQRVAESGHMFFAPFGHYGFGEALAAGGDLRKAAEAYRRAVEAGEGGVRPLAAHALGVLQGKLGDYEGAVASYKVAISDGNDKSRLALGLLYGERGDLEAAEQQFAQLTRSTDPGLASSAFALIDMIRRGNFPPEPEA